jgi:hypothetical protein
MGANVVGPNFEATFGALEFVLWSCSLELDSLVCAVEIFSCHVY